MRWWPGPGAELVAPGLRRRFGIGGYSKRRLSRRSWKARKVRRRSGGSNRALSAPCATRSTRGRETASGTPTPIVDLGAGPDNKIYVVELAKASWLQVELNGATEGGLFVQYPGRHHEGGYKRELAKGKLSLPGGVGVSKHGDVYVSSPVFGPGSVAKVRH
jgi:hypothetical protein